MNVIIDDNARVMYGKICPVSTEKCESFTELDYKIQRCIDLGKKNITKDGKIIVHYHSNRFEIDGDQILNIRRMRYSQHIAERKKTAHYYETYKVMV